MIKLLGHYLKKRLHILIIVSSIMILLHMVIFGGEYVLSSIISRGYGTYEMLQTTNNPITYYLVFAIVLTTLVPIFEFRFKMNKVSVDHFYALPIKREKLYATKFVLGLIEIIVPLTLFFIYSLISISLNENIFNLGYYFVFFFGSLLLIFAIYSINSLAFSKCNRVVDGIINMILYMFIFLGIYLLLLVIIYLPMDLFNKESLVQELAISKVYLLIPQWGLVNFGTYLQNFMDNNMQRIYQYEVIIFIILIILGVASSVILILFSNKEKAEKTLDISDSYFAYKTIIPLYVFLAATSLLEVSVLIIAAILGYIGYVIYRRSFKIQKIDLMMLGGSLVTGVICSLLVEFVL